METCTISGLQQHSVIHTDTKPFVCEVCGRGFRFKSNMFEHRTVHTGYTPHLCPFCGKQFRLKGNMKKHMRVHVTNKEELEAAYRPYSRFERRSKFSVILSLSNFLATVAQHHSFRTMLLLYVDHQCRFSIRKNEKLFQNFNWEEIRRNGSVWFVKISCFRFLRSMKKWSEWIWGWADHVALAKWSIVQGR